MADAEWNPKVIRVAVNGIAFEVATMEPAMVSGSDAGAVPFAICLHGFPECAFSWRYQMPLLAGLGYRVWAPNLRGYGGSDSPAEVTAYSLETLVADAAGLIRAGLALSGTHRAVVIGHDWGGVLAWMLAMWHPDLLDRLIVMNLPHPACFLREVWRPRQMLRSWYVLFFQLPWIPEYLLGRDRAYAVGQMFLRTTMDTARFPEDAIEVYRENASRPGGLRAMLNWYRALLRGGGLRSMERKGWPLIEVRTLMVWGDQDTALSLRTTEGTAQYVRDLTLEVLPGVSHWVQQEAPEAVNAILRRWLSLSWPSCLFVMLAYQALIRLAGVLNV